MSIEPLKEQARTHEQKEEWAKAVDLYKKAIAKLEREDQPDIGLYNRVADLQVRQGQLEDAAKFYERAIELYVEAELPNNAIAVCKKIVRNMPMRHSVYLRMGQIRGKQGFLTEARQNFLTYAERMQSTGKIDEGLRALGELADLAPEDVEIRLAIAGQMQAHGRKNDAIVQLQHGFHAANERGLPTARFEKMLDQLGATAGLPPAKVADDDLGGFGEILVGGAQEDTMSDEDVGLGGFGDILVGGAREDEAGGATPPATFDFASDEVDADEAAVLPLLGDGSESEEDSQPLPLLGDGFAATRHDAAAAAVEEDGAELDAAAFGERDERAGEIAESGGEFPELEFGELALEAPSAQVPEQAREAAMDEALAEKRAPAPPPLQRPGALPEGLAPRPDRPSSVSERDPMGHEALAERGDVTGAMAALRKLVRSSPDDLALRHKMVEYAVLLGDAPTKVSAWLELAETFEREHLPDKAKPLYQQVLGVDPENAQALQGLGRQPKAAVAAAGEYVDLGSFLLDEEEKTTRFVVAYEEPSGDEQADFAKMLSQFRAKVAENLGTDDVRAHQDLGTAYKEMGLIDEAISEFQQALRASANYLPSYELLGQCFMEKGEPEAAVKTLNRALDAPHDVEDELLGIYYWLGRAHQQLGNKSEAVEFYDRVFSLDINFADVTERLRALR